MPSPVAQYALDKGFSSDLILTPERAGEHAVRVYEEYFYNVGHQVYFFHRRTLYLYFDTFLSTLKALQPELCITAAYGNILPTEFLNIPALGTVNIHPSLLPLYRGAAPVQRALQDGVKETGVSLAFTVRALDAGPVIASEKFEVDEHIKAPDLLALLFLEGSKLLIRELPSILDGSAEKKAQPQDESKATKAPKIAPDEAWLSFDQEAYVLHNKVRAFAGWPGTRAKIVIVDEKSGRDDILEFKIITTRLNINCSSQETQADEIRFVKDALVFPCGGTTPLEVLEVQLPGKKVVNASAFWNGMQGKKLKKFDASKHFLHV
ncbi:uncharacterized protein LOC103496854 isoform X3 [Cucumis melo]|nr:uncharacterized protein LOC103496854 isoform X3 [Cucumis melo]